MLDPAKEGEYTRRVKDISKILEEIYDLKIKNIEHKVAADENQEDNDVWDQEMQSKAHVYETIIETLGYQMRKLRQGGTEKQGLEDELITKQRDSKGVESSSTIETKLPKLNEINGRYIDWTKFWNQFEAEIDKSNLSSILKFSYLKEMLEPKVRLIVVGLPLNTEGYTRAKNILTSTYGKVSEVVNAHVQAITNCSWQ